MNSMHYEDCRNRLRAYRKKLGYNQTQMGEILGISQDDYSKRENGRIIISFSNIKSLQMLGMDVDELVCGNRDNIVTTELDNIMSGYKEDDKTFVMKVIAESIMYYRNSEIKKNGNITNDDLLLDYMLKQWDHFSMLEYVRSFYHYSQDTMSEILCLPRKRYRLYEKEQEYPDAETLVHMYNIYNCRPSMYLNMYDRRYYIMQRIWVSFNEEHKDKVKRMGTAIKGIL